MKETIAIPQHGTTTSSQLSQISPVGPALSDDELRDQIEDDLERLFFSQAETAMIGGAAYGAAIILTSALHYLASLKAGPGGDVSGKEIRNYVVAFLPGYDPEAVYRSLRCGLFHRGVPQHGKSPMGVTLDEDPANHDPDGTKLIHPGTVTIAVPQFLADLRQSLAQMLTNTHTDAALLKNCRGTHEKYRPITFAEASMGRTGASVTR